MTRRIAVAVTSALLSLIALTPARRVLAYVEAGEAPALLPGQTPSESPLVAIDGSFAALDDVDLYRIQITDAAAFAAATTASPGADTVLFLFDTSGLAIAGNDDITGGTSVDEYWSRLTGIAGLTNGTYLLSISRWPYFPVSAGGSMYATDPVSEVLLPDQGVAYPTGPGGTQTLTGWANAFGSNDPLAPAYSIALTGVPETRDGVARAAAFLAIGALATRWRRSR